MVETNKRVYICFLLSVAMLAVSPMRAADMFVTTQAPAASASQDAGHASGRKSMVVRADPRTGKLVRTVVVSHPAASHAAPVAPDVKSASKGKESRDAGISAPGIAAPGITAPGITAMVEHSARAHHVDPLLVHSVIKVESNYDQYAISPKGAEGLMQLTPSTAAMLGVSNSFDPQENIEAGVKYLKYLQDLYKDDRLALAAYNAGPAAVEKYKWIPPYPETRKYVDQVGKRYDAARQAAAATQAEADARAAAAVPANMEDAKAPEDRHPKLEQFVDENGRLSLKTTQ